MKEIRHWFETPPGRHVLATEERVLEQLLPGYFGYHLLQMSVQGRALFDSSVIQHKFHLQHKLHLQHKFHLQNKFHLQHKFHNANDPEEGAVVADCENLPFEEDSLDVVLLHHMLEFYPNPQQLLREVSRVARPMGQVVIVGFNPLSLWGLWQPIGRLRRERAPWHGRYILPGRLMDWMNLLNFKIDRVHYCLYGVSAWRNSAELPDYSHGLSRYANLPFGGVYIIVARKQVGTLTPMKPIWKRSRAFGKLSVVQSPRPAAGQVTTRDLPPGAD